MVGIGVTWLEFVHTPIHLAFIFSVTNMDTRPDKWSSTSTRGQQPIPLSSILGG